MILRSNSIEYAKVVITTANTMTALISTTNQIVICTALRPRLRAPHAVRGAPRRDLATTRSMRHHAPALGPPPSSRCLQDTNRGARAEGPQRSLWQTFEQRDGIARNAIVEHDGQAGQRRAAGGANRHRIARGDAPGACGRGVQARPRRRAQAGDARVVRQRSTAGET